MSSEFGISLVAVKSLEVRELKKLTQDSTFSNIAVVPSHFYAAGKPLMGPDLERRCGEILETGKNVSSVQGLLYGIDTGCQSSLNGRAKWIRSILGLLSCDLIVLGAPDLRQSQHQWVRAVEALSIETRGVGRLSVENLCKRTCSKDDFHPWQIWDEPVHPRVFDFANALDCGAYAPSTLGLGGPFEAAHISGPSHTAVIPKPEINEFLTTIHNLSSGGLSKFVVEIFEPDIEILLRQGSKFLESYM